MINNEFRNQLIEIYQHCHEYASYVMLNVTPEALDWIPGSATGGVINGPATQSGSIYNYCTHLINIEIHWLFAFEKPDFAFIKADERVPINDLIEKYKTLEQRYVQLLQDASDEDLAIRETKATSNYTAFLEGRDKEHRIEVNQRGTIAWTVLRIALHALSHITQMTYILHNLGVYNDKEDRWWNTTEKIIALGTLAQRN